MDRRLRHQQKWWYGIAISVPLFTVSFIGGYGLSELVYMATGYPADIWRTLIAGLLGLGIFSIFIRIIIWMSRIRGHKKERLENYRNQFYSETIEAMDRIAHGDFSVFVPVNEHDPFSELAESINRMARELGSMENLRQDFISNVSHEIQSPLTSIAGFAELLKSETLSKEQRAHYIDVIETEAGRLSKLSENLLRLSTLESSEEPLNVKTFSLDKQIQNAVLVLEPQWEAKDIDMSLSLDKSAYNGDEGLLSQVWINLIHNAIKFTPENGNISVTLTSGAEKAVCRISDTGCGISEEDRLRIFERFYKADRSRERVKGGNGLGLSLVKKIVELHGGNVSVDSRVGEGSIFTVTLPIKK